MLSGLSGCLVHDHWQTYCKRPGVLHAMCNAHHLRELQALVEIDGEDWARRMQQLLRRARRARRAAELAREQCVPLPRSLLARIERRYDRLLEQALAYHARLPGLPAGAQEAAAGTQSGVVAAGPQGVAAALLGRLRGAVYEQPGGAGHAHDEAAHEDLGVFPDGAGSAGLRDAAQRAVDGEEAGLEPYRSAAKDPGRVARRTPHLTRAGDVAKGPGQPRPFLYRTGASRESGADSLPT